MSKQIGMISDTLLDEGPSEEFQGATLQIHQDLYLGSRSPSSLGDDSESVAKLPLSPDVANLQSKDVTRINQEDTSLKPAVSGGFDVVSPIVSIPKKISQKLKRSWSAPRSDMACQIPSLAEEEARDFFTFRDGLVEAAVQECTAKLVVPENDGEFVASWLLTEISLWDNEKERLILLTTKTLISIKYDFIALKHLEHRKVSLQLLDTLVIGDLIYPTGSLVPSRNIRGLRAMWNRGEPLAFSKKWNPFNNQIPWTTYSSHPLLWHKESEGESHHMYDVDDFASSLVTAVENAQREEASSAAPCRIEHKPIILENYVGLSSLIHNRNALGFFKVRGKFSF